MSNQQYYDDIRKRASERKPNLITRAESDYIASHSKTDPQPLYRAQYECRHCLERFALGEWVSRNQIPSPLVSPGLILHNCTPDIIGVADLQCFVKQ